LVNGQSSEIAEDSPAARSPGRSRPADRLPTIKRIRSELGARLRARAPEMVEAIFARIHALSDPAESVDPEYLEGLRQAVREAVDFGITSIELGAEWTPPAPPAVAIQAQRAARAGVSLDTVLRRYAAGDRIVGEFIVEEADKFPGQIVGQVMKARGPLVDQLMAHAATHYMRELERLTRSPEQRRAEIVERLLAGDAGGDAGDLDYKFDSWHIGMIVTGEKAEAAVRLVAGDLNCRALIVPRGTRTAWAWLGRPSRADVAEVECILDRGGLAGVSLAIGEPRHGLDGWRLSHQEAQAGFQILLLRPERLVRGSETLLLAAILRDSALAKSLLKTYLAPLDEHGDSGPVLRETLRAYLAAGRNAATAAAALAVDRHTVQRRLRKVEEALGRLLSDCHAELEVALRLEEVGGVANTGDPVSVS